MLRTAYYKKELILVHISENIKNTNLICKICSTSVIPKKGHIKIHHFAHKRKSLCDNWLTNKMTKWHQSWQNICKIDNIEVIIKKNNQKHIADIYNNNLVIEIQHSNISLNDIVDRENFYGNMIWIIDLKNKWDEESGKLIGKERGDIYIQFKDNFIIFNSNYKFFKYMSKPVYLDTDHGILKLIYSFDYGYYLCQKIDFNNFINKYFEGILKDDIKDNILSNMIEDRNYCYPDIYDLNIKCNILNNKILLTGKECRYLSGYKFNKFCHEGVLRHLGFDFNNREYKWEKIMLSVDERLENKKRAEEEKCEKRDGEEKCTRNKG